VTKIVFSKVALENLQEQALYIFEKTKSVQTADAYLEKMRSFIVEMLTMFPNSGRPTPELALDTRKLVYQGFSIIYKVEDDQVQVLTIYRENIPKL